MRTCRSIVVRFTLARSPLARNAAAVVVIATTAFAGVPGFQYAASAQSFRRLTAADGAPGDLFGVSVAAASNFVVVGASCSDWTCPEAGFGSAYVYRFNGTDWAEEAKLVAPDGNSRDQFGWSVAASDGVIVVASLGPPNGGAHGTTYVYRHDQNGWDVGQQLRATEDATVTHYGTAVAADKDVIVVGGQTGLGEEASGVAYVFRFDGTAWIEEGTLRPYANQHDFFGLAVAVSGDVILVSADADDEAGPNAGAVYVYRFDGSSWSREQKLFASSSSTRLAFGMSVAVSGNRALVGSALDATNGESAGAVYPFSFDGTKWVKEVKIVPDNGARGDQFGGSLAMSGDRAVVSSWGANNHRGAVDLFVRVGAQWVLQPRVEPEEFSPFIGGAVAVSADLAVATGSNSAYVFGTPTTSTSREYGDEDTRAAGITVLPTYPNPFTTSTHIRFELSTPATVNVAVYDVRGRHVATLAEGLKGAGQHEIEFEATRLPAGIYYCRIVAGAEGNVVALALVKSAG